jgi:hypothetical protein
LLPGGGSGAGSVGVACHISDDWHECGVWTARQGTMSGADRCGEAACALGSRQEEEASSDVRPKFPRALCVYFSVLGPWSRCGGCAASIALARCPPACRGHEWMVGYLRGLAVEAHDEVAGAFRREGCGEFFFDNTSFARLQRNRAARSCRHSAAVALAA